MRFRSIRKILAATAVVILGFGCSSVDRYSPVPKEHLKEYYGKLPCDRVTDGGLSASVLLNHGVEDALWDDGWEYAQKRKSATDKAMEVLEAPSFDPDRDEAWATLTDQDDVTMKDWAVQMSALLVTREHMMVDWIVHSAVSLAAGAKAECGATLTAKNVASLETAAQSVITAAATYSDFTCLAAPITNGMGYSWNEMQRLYDDYEAWQDETVALGDLSLEECDSAGLLP